MIVTTVVDSMPTLTQELSKRNFRRWGREALERGLIYWHRHFLRYHFTTYAFSRYLGVFKMRVKTSSYRKVGGGWAESRDPRPLYESGATRMMALSYFTTGGMSIGGQTRGALAASRAGIGGETIVAKGNFEVPAYVNFLKGKGFDVDKELTFINESEWRQMVDVIWSHMEKLIASKGERGLGMAGLVAGLRGASLRQAA